MYIRKSRGCYYLAEGRDPIERIVAYGNEPPTFTTPDLRNGLCENELPDIPDATRIDRMDTVGVCPLPPGTLQHILDCPPSCLSMFVTTFD